MDKTNTIMVVLIVIGISIITFVVIDVNINKSSSITGDVIKTLRNCEEVEIPYTIVEEYDYYPEATVISGYQKEKIELFGRGIYQEGIVLLKNMDDEAGWFTVYFNWETLKDKYADTVRHYIEPDETIEFISQYDTDLGEDTQFMYNYKADSITKTRTITKYRIEERCE